MRRFRRDPLGFIENLCRCNPAGVFRLPWGGWCVSDADLARLVLRDPSFNGGMASFFGTLLPSRSAQVELGRAVRDTLRARMPEYRDSLAAAVAELPMVSQWPAAGTELVYRGTADLLLHPHSSPRLRRLMEQAARRGVIIRAPRVRQRAQAEAQRSKLIAALTEQIRDRRRNSDRAGKPRDVLDTVIDACPDEVANRAVVDLYTLLFGSIVGTVGHSVAWSVLLAGLHHPPGSPWPWPANWVVREALRHRPVVWMVGRPIPHPAEFGGIPFQPGEILSVCPYLLHHDEHLWTHPGVFWPERWAKPNRSGPYMPFSAGPFICAGASVAHTLITEAVTALTSDARLTVTGGDTRPIVTNAATPRPFTLHRTTKPQISSPPRGRLLEGGDQP
jgi:cytochrome P450